MRIAPGWNECFGGKKDRDGTLLVKMTDSEHPAVEKTADGERVKTPKAVLFFVLSILWIFPSFGAGWIMANDFSTVHHASFETFLPSIKLEQWLVLLLLALHAVFIFLAMRFRRRERRA